MKSHLQSLSLEAQPRADLALVCNPKGQRSHEFPPADTLRNLLNLVMDSLSTFAYGIDRPVASRVGFVLEGFLCYHEHSRFQTGHHNSSRAREAGCSG